LDEEGQCFGEVEEILNAGGSEIYVVRVENLLHKNLRGVTATKMT